MTTTKVIIGMRDAFFNALYPLFQQNKRAVIVTADTGAPTLDQYWQNLPEQFINVGIAEQQMIGMACGLALEGRKVYTYAIAPFITLRCYEHNKLDICAMKLPIVNLGVGAGYAYDIMGPTHHTTEDISIMRALPNLVIYSPADGITATALAKISFENPGPQYIRFDRAGIPDLYQNQERNFFDGLIVTKPGKDLCLLATGAMVHTALKVAAELERQRINAEVIDVFRLKPLNEELLFKLLKDTKKLVTLEEHRLPGGFGSLIAEALLDARKNLPLLRIGMKDQFVFDLGGREVIWEKYGLDAKNIAQKILNFVAA